jgi:lactoylglutathione lyase
VSTLDHVGLSVADLDAAAAFYERAFDFAREFPFELPGDIRGLMMRAPEGHRLELFQAPEARPGLTAQTPLEALATRGYGHFALDAGARSVRSPSPSPEPGVRFAFLADPEGNLVELVERRDGAGMWRRGQSVSV